LRVSLHLIDKLSELLDIVGHRGSLFGLKKLANEKFLLIVVKTIVKEATKGLPVREIELGFDGLKPTSCYDIEMLFGNSNPERRVNIVHLEIVSTEGAPTTRIVTIETRERQLGKTTGGVWCGGVSGNSKVMVDGRGNGWRPGRWHRWRRTDAWRRAGI
jgi:hypothetical protein